MLKSISYVALLLVSMAGPSMQRPPYLDSTICTWGPCNGQQITCPEECPMFFPYLYAQYASMKACFPNCESPTCEPQCRNRRPDCFGVGAACFDPRFIGGDGIVFYFHGKKDQTFSLVSDPKLQINARFIGHRPTGRTRDNTWIQALGILFNSQTFSLEATKAETWDDEVDHLSFSFDGNELAIPQAPHSTWHSEARDIKVQRISGKNDVIVTLKDTVEIMVKVVPITKEDDRVHKYQLPSDDCFAHLEVQFKFRALSPKVEGVLGRTYQPDFKNPAKPGVAMPVVGGEDKYRTTSLLSADCKFCIFSPGGGSASASATTLYETLLDCTRSFSAALGHGIVCKR